MRDWGADEADVADARDVQVVDEGGLAGQQGRILLPQDRVAQAANP